MKSESHIKKPLASLVVAMLVLCSFGAVFTFETEDIAAADLLEDGPDLSETDIASVDAQLIDSVLAGILSYSAMLPYSEPSKDATLKDGTFEVDSGTVYGDLVLADGTSVTFVPGATLTAERIFLNGDVQFQYAEGSATEDSKVFSIKTQEILVQNLSLTDGLFVDGEYFTVRSDGTILVTSESKNLGPFITDENLPEELDLSYGFKIFAYGESFSVGYESKDLEISVDLPPNNTEPVIDLSVSLDLTGFQNSLKETLVGVSLEELFNALVDYLGKGLVLPSVSIHANIPEVSETRMMTHEKSDPDTLDCVHTYWNTVKALAVSLTTDPASGEIDLSASVGKLTSDVCETFGVEVENDESSVEDYVYSISYSPGKCVSSISCKKLVQSELDGLLVSEGSDQYSEYTSWTVYCENVKGAITSNSSNLLGLVDIYGSAEDLDDFVQKVCGSGILLGASGEFSVGTYSEESLYSDNSSESTSLEDEFEVLNDVKLRISADIATGGSVGVSVGEYTSGETCDRIGTETADNGDVSTYEVHSSDIDTIKDVAFSANADIDDLLRIISLLVYGADGDGALSDDLVAAIVTASFSNNGISATASMGSFTNTMTDNYSESLNGKVFYNEPITSKVSFAADSGSAVTADMKLKTEIGSGTNLKATLSVGVLFGTGAVLSTNSYSACEEGGDFEFISGSDFSASALAFSMTDVVVDAPYAELPDRLEEVLSAVAFEVSADVTWDFWDYDMDDKGYYYEDGSDFVQGQCLSLGKAYFAFSLEALSGEDFPDLTSEGTFFSAERLFIGGYRTDGVTQGYVTFASVISDAKESFEVSGTAPLFQFIEGSSEVTSVSFGTLDLTLDGDLTIYIATSETQDVGFVVTDETCSWYSPVPPADGSDYFSMSVRAYSVVIDPSDSSKAIITADSDTVEVAGDLIDSLIKGSASSGNITIEADMGGKDSMGFVLDHDSVSDIEGSGMSLTMNTAGSLSVTLDQGAMSTVAAYGDGKTTLTLNRLSASDLAWLPPELLNEVDGKTVISIDLTVGITTIHELNGTATVSLPYEKTEEGEVVVYYLNTQTNSLEKIEGATYKDGIVTFTTDHFSLFSISQEKDSGSDDDSTIYIVGIAAILIVLVLAFFLLRRKDTA